MYAIPSGIAKMGELLSKKSQRKDLTNPLDEGNLIVSGLKDFCPCTQNLSDALASGEISLIYKDCIKHKQEKGKTMKQEDKEIKPELIEKGVLKKKYEAPKVIRLSALNEGVGRCNAPGNSDAADCDGTGNAAHTFCKTGNSASPGYCDTNGVTPAGICNHAGSNK
jgi:hypothetical protein